MMILLCSYNKQTELVLFSFEPNFTLIHLDALPLILNLFEKNILFPKICQ